MRTRRPTTIHRPRTRTGLRAAAPAALVAGLVLAGCADDGATTGDGTTTDPGATQSAPAEPGTPSPTGSGEQVEISALLADGTVYDGQLVTTSGTVTNVAPGVVTLAPDGATAASPAPTGTAASPTPTGTGTPQDGTETGTAGQGVLYVLHSAAELPADGTTATVTGTVRDPFDPAAVEESLGVTIDQRVLDTLPIGDDDVVLLAELVTSDGTDGGTASPTPSG